LILELLFKKGAEGIKTYGIDKLIQVAASQLSDQLPESREAARALLLELQNVYEKFHDLMASAVNEHTINDHTVNEHTVNEHTINDLTANDHTVNEHPEMSSWESFCQSKLSPLSAQAVLRVTSIAREGLVSWHAHQVQLEDFLLSWFAYHFLLYIQCYNWDDWVVVEARIEPRFIMYYFRPSCGYLYYLWLLIFDRYINFLNCFFVILQCWSSWRF